MTMLTRTPSETAEANAKRARTRRVRRWVGRAAWGTVAVLVAASIGLAWRPKPLEVDTAAASRGDLVVTVDEVGKTRVRDRYVVAAPLAGNMLRVELRAGDAVKAGAVLARITPMQAPLLDPRTRSEAASRSAAAAAGQRQSQAAVARAELAAGHAKDELDEAKRLAQSGSLAPDAVTRAELDARVRAEELASAKFAAQMAAHEAAMAQAALARFGATATDEGFDVTAPISGTVLRVVRESAGPVTPGAEMVEVGDPAALEIATDVLTADAVRIRTGAKVTVERWGGPPLAAHVRRVEPSATTRISALGVEEQRVPVVIDLDEPRERWQALGDGFRVETRIVLDERRGVLRAPIGAVFRHDGGWAVYAVRDGAARLTPVTLGSKSDAEVELASGVGDGDVLVVHPSEKIADGTKVVAR